MQTYTVIAADLEKDREAIIDVWKRNASHTERLGEKFDWHFHNNPYGTARCWLLLANDVPIGTSALGMRALKIGATTVQAGVACDLAVDKEHRTLRPALLLQQAVVSAIQTGVQVIYGLPNARGAAPIRRIGYKDAGTVNRHAKVLRASVFLERNPRLRWTRFFRGAVDLGWRIWSRLHETQSKGYETAIVQNFDERFDDLWSRDAAGYPVIGVRDSKFLNWRFKTCPLQNYMTMALLSRDKSQVLGYATWFMDESRIMCTDLFVSSEDGQAEALLAGIAEHGRNIGATSVSIAAALPAHIVDAFERSRFALRSTPPSTAKTAALPPDSQQQLARALLVYASPDSPALSNPWYFTAGDEPYN